MSTANTHYNKKPGSGKTWAGLILVVLGIIFLIRSLGGLIPDWLTSWPMILIILGLFSGSRNNFRNPGAFILIFIGAIFLSGRIIPGIELHDFVFPALIIGLGLYLILGKRRDRFRYRDRFDRSDRYSWDKKVGVTDSETQENAEAASAEAGYSEPNGTFSEQKGAFSSDYGTFSGEDYLDTVSVFGGIKKNIVSKHFKGGEIVTIMGGAEINLSQADIQGTVIIDVTQVFGGTKLIVPPQWKVSSDLAALFGGIEDKRPLMAAGTQSDDKVLILRGTSIFGGIDIRSF